MAKTKFEQMKTLIEEEVYWSQGAAYPWEGQALASPWFLERLALLAAHAPQTEIDQLKKELEADG